MRLNERRTARPIVDPAAAWNLGDMPDVADLRERIGAACARAASGNPGAGLLADLEALLAEGYICALQGDRARSRLEKRLAALVEASDGEASADEFRAVARGQRAVSEATQQLRADLAVMRAHWAALGGERQLGAA